MLRIERLFRSQRARRIVYSTIAIIAGLSVAPASAQTHYVRAQTRVQTGGFGVCDPQYVDNDTGQVQAPTTSSGPTTVSSGGPSPCAAATATAYGHAEFGVLRGYASYTASTIGAASGGQSQGTPEAFHDTITPVSGSLPDGTMVTLEATLIFNRTLSASGGGDVQTSLQGPFGLYIADSLAIPDSTHSVTTTTTWFTGFPLSIDVSLYFQAAGTANPGSVNGHIDIPSAVFTLKCLTPDTSYTTASGVSYAPLLDADVNVSGTGNGADIGPFTAGILSGSTAASDLYHADFDGSGIIDAGDIPGFVAKLIAP